MGIVSGDSVSLLAGDIPSQCQVMITDPPYSSHVHKNATSQSPGRGARHRDLGFDYLSPVLRRAVARWASQVRRWSIVYSDVESANWLRISGQTAGATYVRTMPWVRWSMPQLSGDRPPQGFEVLLVFWGAWPAGEKSWNGPGSLTHLSHLAMRGETKHKAEKPLDQCLDLVSWFSNEGEIVLDPFAGSGAIARACQLLGRHSIAIEKDPAWAVRARERLASPLSDAERERVRRWLSQSGDVSKPVGPAAERAERAKADKERLRAYE